MASSAHHSYNSGVKIFLLFLSIEMTPSVLLRVEIAGSLPHHMPSAHDLFRGEAE